MAPQTFSDDAFLAVPYSAPLRRALVRLDELVDWERMRRSVRGQQRLMRVDFQPARRLLDKLGNPQQVFGNRVIHVTGSKGKGTVSALLAYGLQRLYQHASGAGTTCNKVAIYTSPHVERINERIRFDNINVTDDVLAAALHRALDARRQLEDDERERQRKLEQREHNNNNVAGEITWFDTMAAACILAAQEQRASHLVVEVGMGGRRDSTNVFDGAPIALITNIHREHADIIGPTLRDIAYEKAGIIGRHTRTAVIGLSPPTSGSETDSLASIFRDEAAQYDPQPQLVFIPPVDGDSLFMTNLKLARAALDAVIRLDDDTNGMSTTSPTAEYTDRSAEHVLGEEDARKVISSSLPARQEVFHTPRGVALLLDGAHVPQSVEHVLSEVAAQNKRTLSHLNTSSGLENVGNRVVVVVAMGRDKEIDGIVQAIVDSDPVYIVATAVGEAVPYLPADELATHLAQELHSKTVPPFKVIQSPMDAVEYAIDKSIELCPELRAGTDNNGDTSVSVVIVGSLHLAGRVRPLLRSLQEQARSMSNNTEAN